MHTLLILLLITRIDLFFMKDTTNVLLWVTPDDQQNAYVVCYNCNGTRWDSVTADAGSSSSLTIVPPADAVVIGAYIRYAQGTTEPPDGEPRLYEVKRHPRMLMPLSLGDLEKILTQARAKVARGKHVDEAVILLDYLLGIVPRIPTIPGSTHAARLLILEQGIAELRAQLGR